MSTQNQGDGMRQKAGGIAALYIALALVAAMPFFLLVVDYVGVTTAAEKLSVIVADYASLYAMYLASYVFYGLAVGVVALALYDRLHVQEPAMARAATAVGLLWSVALVASGMVWNYGMTTVVGLAKTDPARAADVWQAVEPVSEALGGAGGELLGGLWILLLGVITRRSGALPKPLGWSGLAIGLAGLVSVIPPLHDAAILFGLALIPWFTGLGIVLLRPKLAVAHGRVKAAQSL